MKLNLMERRGVSSQYDKETSELIIKIEQLSSIDLSKINFDTSYYQSCLAFPPLIQLMTVK